MKQKKHKTWVTIPYDGVDYQCRELLDNDGNVVTIAPVSLFKALYPDAQHIKDKMAAVIDECITGYTFDAIFECDNDEMIEHMLLQQPEYVNLFGNDVKKS